MDQLLKDLAPYRVTAIEWALDRWGRNESKLPSLADLLELLREYYLNDSAKCDAECQSRHGKGYWDNDVFWLWKQRLMSKEPWDEARYEEALRELDKKREGGAPEWRR